MATAAAGFGPCGLHHRIGQEDARGCGLRSRAIDRRVGAECSRMTGKVVARRERGTGEGQVRRMRENHREQMERFGTLSPDGDPDIA